jgi:hypothetical protein
MMLYDDMLCYTETLRVITLCDNTFGNVKHYVTSFLVTYHII